MSWDAVQKRVGVRTQSYFIDLDDKDLYAFLVRCILEEVPGLTEEEVRDAVEACRKGTIPPRSCFTVLLRIERLLQHSLRSTGTNR